MTIDWTKPLRTVGTHLPVEFISDKGRRQHEPILCYVENYKQVYGFTCDRLSLYCDVKIENTPDAHVERLTGLLREAQEHLERCSVYRDLRDRINTALNEQ